VRSKGPLNESKIGIFQTPPSPESSILNSPDLDAISPASRAMEELIASKNLPEGVIAEVRRASARIASADYVDMATATAAAPSSVLGNTTLGRMPGSGEPSDPNNEESFVGPSSTQFPKAQRTLFPATASKSDDPPQPRSHAPTETSPNVGGSLPKQQGIAERAERYAALSQAKMLVAKYRAELHDDDVPNS